MINVLERDYKFLLRSVLITGTVEENRTGVSALTLFKHNVSFNMEHGVMPVLTGKQIFYQKAYHEFLWMWNGERNIKYLNAKGIHWWDEYADSNGDLGKTYGYQLRQYNGDFDQIEYVIKEIKKGSRRAYITMWNPTELLHTSLPCCFTGLTFVLTENSKKLNLDISFRSSDIFLGLPYDMIVGALFLKYIAHATNKRLGEINYSLVNAHLYSNHIEQASQYLALPHYSLPTHEEALADNYESGEYIAAKLNN